MLVPYNATFTPEQIKHFDAIKEVLVTIEPKVAELVADHRRNTKRWYPHEVLPWGMGRDFVEDPWSIQDCKLRPEVVLALDTNLLTEDNLPYYHAQIEQMLGKEVGIWREWNRLWTAEEAKHAETMRDYLYLVRAMDPKLMEDNRFQMMETGFDRHFGDPLEIFTYTAAQELATRVSHLRTGQKADEPMALRLMTIIARDENFHHIFYRGVVKHALDIAPELTLQALVNQLYDFEMPGKGLSNFEFRQQTIANAGIYGAREHRDMIIMPLIKFWDIEHLTGLTPAGRKNQERLLKLEKLLTRMVERQDRSDKKSE
jgi:acyl-[acyl-carrier-protein] desaturase